MIPEAPVTNAASYLLVIGLIPQAQASPPTYAGLPNVTGYSPDRVKTVIGMPVVTASKAGVVTWLYSTPDGDRRVYFLHDIATMSDPKKRRPGVPEQAAGCGQAAEARSVIVVAANTPVFPGPRVRTEAVDRLAAGTLLAVIRTAGAWFAVSLPGPGTYAYIHCSDVRVMP